jgi:hypothetical protein
LGRGTADGFGFGLAGGTDWVDAKVVFIGFQDFVEAMVQGDEFFFAEETFEEAVLSPLSKAAKGFVDFGATFVVGDVVGDEVEGGHRDLRFTICDLRFAINGR